MVKYKNIIEDDQKEATKLKRSTLTFVERMKTLDLNEEEKKIVADFEKIVKKIDYKGKKKAKEQMI
jgi:hypothetical protein